ncbi:MAG TPA: tRNA pseudouridine(55) synthase TruB [Vicinamibacterales bacterium]|nr:tRNA pseudouridine(55) synthase TruB [Vicinamibacterales bacterium]
MSAPIDGVLVVDKPAGPTSHDVVSVGRRALGTPKVGHTGTLDPMASGVLVLVVGRATRLARYMSGDEKVYEAQVTFGRSTDTYDALGATTLDTGRQPERDALAAALAAYTGPIVQTPPAFSAKKIAGEAAYKRARRDAPVLPDPVAVTVHALGLTAYDRGIATLTLRVSAGFYVRSLAHDLGTKFGTGAHLSALRRTRAGAFGLDQAVPWETLAGGGAVVQAAVLPIDRLLPEIPGVVLAMPDATRVRHGQTVLALLPPGTQGSPLRLLDQGGRLIGIAKASPHPAAGPSPWLLQPVVIVG